MPGSSYTLGRKPYSGILTITGSAKTVYELINDSLLSSNNLTLTKKDMFFCQLGSGDGAWSMASTPDADHWLFGIGEPATVPDAQFWPQWYFVKTLGGSVSVPFHVYS